MTRWKDTFWDVGGKEELLQQPWAILLHEK